MSTRTLPVVILTLTFLPNAFASLPPYWDRVSQLETVTQSSRVANVFGEEIDSITFVRELTYRVSAKACAMDVNLRVDSASKYGPVTYSVDDVGQKNCK